MILYLTNPSAPFSSLFQEAMEGCGQIVEIFYDHNPINFSKYTYIITDRYSKILPTNICEAFHGRALNLHASILPLCRGSYPIPNALLRNEPVGFTIHLIAPKVDTGEVIWQEKIEAEPTVDTLKTLWMKTQLLMLSRLCTIFEPFQTGSLQFQRIDIQGHQPSFHYRTSIKFFEKCLTDGWNTKIIDFVKADD
jgi:methionyl-tRNA formyltransferase